MADKDKLIPPPPLGHPFEESEAAKKDPELADLLKALAERGKTFKDAPGLLEALRGLIDPAHAQKRAAETNQVDDALANQWFREHWKDRRCPICQQVTWAMAPTFAHIATSLLGRVAPVSSFPCVVLTCRVCGNTLFFNAVAMKLLPEGSE